MKMIKKTSISAVALIAALLSFTSTNSYAGGKKKKGEAATNSEAGSGQPATAEPGQGSKAARERNLVREGRQKKGDSSKIDFDSTSIAGQRKLPLGSLVNQNKPDKEYDFVKLRWQWHPEMVQSASSLEGGRSR